MARKREQKEERLALRMSSKLRYGLDLMSERRYKVSESEMICRAVELLLEREGLTARAEGELLSLLDRLWQEDRGERVLALADLAPELLSDSERHAITWFDFYEGNPAPEKKAQVVEIFVNEGISKETVERANAILASQ